MMCPDRAREKKTWPLKQIVTSEETTLIHPVSHIWTSVIKTVPVMRSSLLGVTSARLRFWVSGAVPLSNVTKHARRESCAKPDQALELMDEMSLQAHTRSPDHSSFQGCYCLHCLPCPPSGHISTLAAITETRWLSDQIKTLSQLVASHLGQWRYPLKTHFHTIALAAPGSAETRRASLWAEHCAVPSSEEQSGSCHLAMCFYSLHLHLQRLCALD